MIAIDDFLITLFSFMKLEEKNKNMKSDDVLIFYCEEIKNEVNKRVNKNYVCDDMIELYQEIDQKIKIDELYLKVVSKL